jgi:hypothetical protein
MTTRYASGLHVDATDRCPLVEYTVRWRNQEFKILNTDPSLQLFCTQRSRVFIADAVLYNVYDVKKTRNVYNEILPYAGPNHDFFGQTVNISWMFPDGHLQYTNIALQLTTGRVLNLSIADKIHPQLLG